LEIREQPWRVTVVRSVPSCSLANGHRRPRGTDCLHIQWNPEETDALSCRSVEDIR